MINPETGVRLRAENADLGPSPVRETAALLWLARRKRRGGPVSEAGDRRSAAGRGRGGRKTREMGQTGGGNASKRRGGGRPRHHARLQG